MYVVGIDPGFRNLGVAVLDFEEFRASGAVKVVETITLDLTCGQKGQSVTSILGSLRALNNLPQLKSVYIESQYTCNGRLSFLSQKLKNIEWGVACYLSALHPDATVGCVNSKELKSFFGLSNDGNYLNKKNSMDWIKRHSPTGSKGKMSHHEADAIMVAVRGVCNTLDVCPVTISLQRGD